MDLTCLPADARSFDEPNASISHVTLGNTEAHHRNGKCEWLECGRHAVLTLPRQKTMFDQLTATAFEDRARVFVISCAELMPFLSMSVLLRTIQPTGTLQTPTLP